MRWGGGNIKTEQMYIKKVSFHRFKQFRSQDASLLEGISLVVGANNSGKSSILQALGTWQFCKTLIEIEKGRLGWLETKTKSGVGLGIVDFTPLQIPSLKHLWTNLKTAKEKEKDGYTLKIGVFWDNEHGDERHLEIGLSLANDRLFVKATSSNLSEDELLDEAGDPKMGVVPQVAYLPPLAGITDREALLTPAMRERMIGQGLSGAVVRNVLYDLYTENRRRRDELGAGRSKIKTSDLKELRRTDSWELLLRTVQSTFGTDLRFQNFNERYHSYLRLECVKGRLEGTVFKKYPKYNARDLMVEGSGFLQWLSVFALALSPEIDVILLDEPDAHLNAALQKELVDALGEMVERERKQVLLATHSPELIRTFDHDRVLSVREQKAKYLNDAEDKIGVLAGIGTVHTPKLHALIQNKRMLIVEGVSDERFLKIIAQRAGVAWPENIVTWFWTGKVSERRQLFLQLKKEIPGLKALSIRDRDDEPVSTVSADLTDTSATQELDFLALKWRRRHIENYLLSVDLIAKTSGKDTAEITSFFASSHSIVLPDDNTLSEIVPAIRDAHGKDIFNKGDCIKSKFSVTRDDVAKAFSNDDVPADIKKFFDHMVELCK